ncbi:Fic family protein [Vulgatibacter sp.]|uniref:Fic family protein n=1 Tax=Vulgatibacter sp. TaxID=1971226 RepID=UPI003563BA3B
MSTRFFSLDERNADLKDLLEAFPEAGAEFRRRYAMSWYHHENALDGIVLTEQELIQALEHHVVGDASLMSVLTTVRNHRSALERVEAEAKSRKTRLAQPFLEELYAILLRDTNPSVKERAVWRKEMPLHRTYFHEIAQPAKIEGELEKLLKFTATAEFKEYHPIRQAAHVHWAFMQVFPFAEHNGKIARLLQTLYLLRGGYLPPVIHGADRQRYYETLRMPSSGLRNLLIEAIENCFENGTRFVQIARSRPSAVAQ